MTKNIDFYAIKWDFLHQSIVENVRFTPEAQEIVVSFSLPPIGALRIALAGAGPSEPSQP